MEYSKLVAVTGMPGLYELVNSKTDGAIVRSLEDNTTRFASSRIHNFSHLESIEVYTTGDNVNLVEIFNAMEKGGNLPDGKDNSALKKYFEKVYPELDFERVYASDLKKMVKWFDILKKSNVEIKLSEPPVEEAEEEEEAIEEPKPAKKAPAAKEEKTEKKTSAKETKKTAEEEPKPAKKTAAAEKDEKKAAPKKKAADKETKSEKKDAPKKKGAPKKK